MFLLETVYQPGTSKFDGRPGRSRVYSYKLYAIHTPPVQ